MPIGFTSEVIDEEPKYVPRKTFIECEECNQIFISREYNKTNAAASCNCGNINIGIHITEYARFENLVTVRWTKSPPKIYEEE